MKRINIDKDWDVDPRRFKLAELTGQEVIADGVMFAVWKEAQRFWENGKKLIPLPVFMKLPYAKDVIGAGLAIHKRGALYVKGSAKHFDWLIRRKEAGKLGGKISARIRSEKNEAKVKQSSSKGQPSSSSSSSSSSSENKYKYSEVGLIGSIEEYQRTLDHFKIKRSAKNSEVKLLSLGSRFGFEDLNLALAGMRREKRTESFNPADHVSLDRIPKNFEKFMNLGAKHGKPSAVEPGQGPDRTNDGGTPVPSDWDKNTASPEVLELLKRTQAK